MLNYIANLALLPLLCLLACALGITSVAVKLSGLVAWMSWWWAFSPFLVAALIALGILAIVVAANFAPDVP